MVDEHDTISRNYTHESDKTYKMSSGHHSTCEPHSDHTSEPSSDDPEKYLENEDNTSKMPIENAKEHQKYADRNQSQKPRGFLLSRIESLIRYSIFFWNSESTDFGLDVIDDRYNRAILCISRDHDATLRVLMIDNIASFRKRYIGNTSDKNTSLR